MGHWIGISSLMRKMHGSFCEGNTQIPFLARSSTRLRQVVYVIRITTQFERIVLSEIVRLILLYVTECWAVKNQHKIKV